MLRRLRPHVSLALLFASFLLALAAALPAHLGLAQPEGGPAVSGSPPPVETASPAPSSAPVAAPPAPPAPAPAPPPPSDQLRVYVLTFSPGDHPFYKFGHNAIWIHDEGTRNLMMRDRVYNYGMFTFGDPKLIPKFFLGRFMYWLDVSTYPGTIRGYKRENRSIDVQELDLSAEQKRELARLLEENAKVENRYYKYDYYRDNCSTRVRDMIDRVTGGRVKAAATAPARLTYRQHTLRLTADLPAEYVILNFVMGNLIDQPVTLWEEAFIPMELQKTLRSVTLLNEDGSERPLVKDERLLLPAENRIPPPADPPTWWPYSLLTGLAIGGAMAGLGRWAEKARGARIGFGIALSVFGLVWGFFGWFFLAAWAFTDHQVGYHNENTLLAVPWSIVLVGSGINLARGKLASAQRARALVKAALGSSVLALALKALYFWFDQANGFFLVFFLPFWGGVFYGVREISRTLAARAATAAKPEASASKATAKPKPTDEDPEKPSDDPAPDKEAPPAPKPKKKR